MNGSLVDSNRILTPNYIETFLLKINLEKKIDLEDFKKCFSSDFERYEEIINKSLEIKISEQTSTVSPGEDVEKVFINGVHNVKVILSKYDSELIIRLNSYINNSSYLWIIDKLIDYFLKNGKELKYKRISLRYVNKFPCLDIKTIKNFFNKDLSKHLVNTIELGNRSRILLQEEIDFNPNKAKVIYGIPNKYYPNKLTEYDLLLDIDSYLITNDNINSLKSDIESLNHSAYEVFKMYVTDSLFN